MPTHTFNKQRAIGLLELMLALVIIAAILLLATRYYVVTERNERVAKGASMINNIIDASTRYAEGVTSVTQGLSMQTLIDTRLLSENYLRSPWSRSGTKTDVRIISMPDKFLITISAIPQKECQNLVDVIGRNHSNIEQECSSQQGGYCRYILIYCMNL